MTPALRVIVRIEAEVDITDAAIWYHGKQLGLGQEFLGEVELAIARAAENPFRYPCLRRKPEVRRVGAYRSLSLSRILHSSPGQHRRLPRSPQRAP